jgi:hypothetical protein
MIAQMPDRPRPKNTAINHQDAHFAAAQSAGASHGEAPAGIAQN